MNNDEFRGHVERTFDFLVHDFGFRRAETDNPWSVRYESKSVCVWVTIEAHRSRELGVWVGKVSDPRIGYLLSFVLAAAGVPDAETYDSPSVWQDDKMAPELARLARALREYGAGLLTDHAAAWMAVEETQKRMSEAYTARFTR